MDKRARVSRRQLSDEVATRVRAQIMAGQLAPGESVRPEVIGSEMGISTTPAREALQLLRAEGFLDLRPGRGFAVAPMTGADILDIFSTQAFIAGELAARAAELVTEGDVQELEELHSKLIDAAERGNTTDLEYFNHEFHRRVNQIPDAKKLRWLLGITTHYVPREFYGSIHGWPQSTMRDHGALLEAIRLHDPASARREMTQHIRNAGMLLASNFDARRQQEEQAADS